MMASALQLGATDAEYINQKFKHVQTIQPPHLHRKISTGVDGGLSGGSSVCRPGSEGPIGASGNFYYLPNEAKVCKDQCNAMTAPSNLDIPSNPCYPCKAVPNCSVSDKIRTCRPCEYNISCLTMYHVCIVTCVALGYGWENRRV